MITLALACTLAFAAPQELTKDLRSKDVSVRLAAVETLANDGHEKVESLLLKALKDKDWEVAERAAAALAKHGTKDSVKPLVKFALEAPVVRMRRVAAESVAAIDAEAAVKELLKKAGGRTAIVAATALENVAYASEVQIDGKRFSKMLKDKEELIRDAGARARVATAGRDHVAVLESLLEHENLAVHAAALETACTLPGPGDVHVAATLLGRKNLGDVIGRRAERLADASLRVIEDVSMRESEARVALSKIGGGANTAVGLARAARVIGRLALPDGLPAETLLELLEPSIDAKEPAARAAAAKALAAIGGDAALARAKALAVDDESARVRRIALQSFLALSDLTEPESVAFVVERLKGDPSNAVQEEAAVALGVKKIKGATAALAAAAGSTDWTIAVVALVSLGKTRADGVENVLSNAASHDDWRIRGAAIVGLGHLYRAQAVPALLAALGDPEPLVARSAHEGLKKALRQPDMVESEDAWTDWWAENEKKMRWVDPEEEAARRAKYDYSVPDSDIYKGLDIVVLLSRGDHIENILEREEILFRTTEAARVPECGLHPDGIFVANCTGEIEGKDVERISWFVRTGGSFFGSCWALSQTIERIYPGVLRKQDMLADVLDDVRAYPCTGTDTFLNGVFQDDVRPIYHLEGAHIIQVLDPERAEVLIDSPDAAERHGGGNLAAWFDAGHGVILDSVNHFDLQGLQVAPGLKSPEDRQVYAMDHCGLDYARWRETRKQKFWGNAHNAAKSIPDNSAFRFVTNFVRAKRIRDAN